MKNAAVRSGKNAAVNVCGKNAAVKVVKTRRSKWYKRGGQSGRNAAVRVVKNAAVKLVKNAVRRTSAKNAVVKCGQTHGGQGWSKTR